MASKGQGEEDGDVGKCGYLLKRGDVNRNYSVQWMVLDSNRLWCYGSPNATKALQVMSLDDAIVRAADDGMGGSRKRRSSSKKDVYYFEVVGQKQVWGLGARSESGRASWMAALASLTMLGMENRYFIKAEEVIRQSELYKYRKRHGSRHQRALIMTPPRSSSSSAASTTTSGSTTTSASTTTSGSTTTSESTTTTSAATSTATSTATSAAESSATTS